MFGVEPSSKQDRQKGQRHHVKSKMGNSMGNERQVSAFQVPLHTVNILWSYVSIYES